MKNKKGFTLIELLAVILVLGIIALIAIPTVNKVIDQAKKGAFERTTENIVKVVEEECQKDMLLGNATAKTYTFTDGVASPTINVKGKLPTSGTIIVDSDCNTTINVSNGKYEVVSGDASNEITIKQDITLVDSNGNGKEDVGEIIRVVSTEGTIEEFYVIEDDDDGEIRALARYNLFVGGKENVTGVLEHWGRNEWDYKEYIAYTGNEEGYGLQRSDMKAWYEPSDGETTGVLEGVVYFSEIDTSYENSTIKTYIDTYVGKLNNVDTGRAITKAELIRLGCSDSDVTCGRKYYDYEEGNFMMREKPLAPEWVYSTSYWSGSSNDEYAVWRIYSVWHVESDGYFISYGSDDFHCSFGVRPVIIISKS